MLLSETEVLNNSNSFLLLFNEEVYVNLTYALENILPIR